MESENSFFTYVPTLVIALLVAAVVAGIVYLVMSRRRTMPLEGFFGGPARGAGIPDCFISSPAAAKLFSIFDGRVGSVEEGSPDLQEFTLLLSQLACFKKDLIGVGGVVEATRYQPFATQIDMEPIAETTARCFAKTIPPRDLELSVDKWSKRGHELISRLCTAANLTEVEANETQKIYTEFLADVADIARAKCLYGEPTLDGKPDPRSAKPYSPPYIADLREYKGWY